MYAKNVEACDAGYSETHRSLICVHMASENDVNLRCNNPLLVHHPHRFTFHVVVGVGVVPGRMHQHKQPGGYIPVHSCKLLLQPSILWGILPVCRVSGEDDDVRRPSPDGVEESTSAVA